MPSLPLVLSMGNSHWLMCTASGLLCPASLWDAGGDFFFFFEVSLYLPLEAGGIFGDFGFA